MKYAIFPFPICFPVFLFISFNSGDSLSVGIPILSNSISSISVKSATSDMLNTDNLTLATTIIVLIIFGAAAATLKCLYCLTPKASGSSLSHFANNPSNNDFPFSSGFPVRIRFKTVVKFLYLLS